MSRAASHTVRTADPATAEPRSAAVFIVTALGTFMASLDRAEAVRIMADVMRATYPAERDADPTL